MTPRTAAQARALRQSRDRAALVAARRAAWAREVRQWKAWGVLLGLLGVTVWMVTR